MENIYIKKISELNDLSNTELLEWKNHLLKVHDPRTIYQVPDFFFKLPTIDRRISHVIAFLIKKKDTTVGLLTFIKLEVSRSINFGFLKIATRKFHEIRSIGAGQLLEADENDSTKIRTEILQKLLADADSEGAHVYFDTLEPHDLFAKSKCADKNFSSLVLKETEAYFSLIEKNFDTFLKAKPISKRESIKYDLKRFEKIYAGKFLVKENPDTLSSEEFINLSRTILQQSWKRGVIGSYVGSPPFEKQLSLLQDLGLVKTFVLIIENEPVAFGVGYWSGINFYYDEIASDERYSKTGAGTYLTMHIMRVLHTHGLGSEEKKSIFSFGVGDNIFKRKLYNYKLSSKVVIFYLPFSKTAFFFRSKRIVENIYNKSRTLGLKTGLHTKIRQKFKKRKKHDDAVKG